MNKGWVNVHESFSEEPVWKESTPEQKVVLIGVLLHANKQEQEKRRAGQMRLIQPWQLVISYRQLADFVNHRFSINEVKSVLKKLANVGFLTYDSCGQHVWITIVQREKFAFEPTNVLSVLYV